MDELLREELLGLDELLWEELLGFEELLWEELLSAAEEEEESSGSLSSGTLSSLEELSAAGSFSGPSSDSAGRPSSGS